MANSKKEKDQEEEEKIVNKGEKVDDDDEDGDGADDEGAKKKRKRKRKRSKKATDGPDTDALATTTNDNHHHEDDTCRTLFVEGVPYDATPEQVAECLVSHAKIVRTDLTELRFPTWQDSGRMRGYGHVVFTSKEIMDTVLKVSASTKFWMGKRYLSLQPARPKGLGPVVAASGAASGSAINPQSEPSKTIMIKNLDYEATEDDIQQVMEQFGSIVEGGVRISRNFQNRQSKGFAYVEFEDLASAKKAMARYQQSSTKPLYILKRACVLDYDEGRIKGSFKTATGRLWSREYKDQATKKQTKTK